LEHAFLFWDTANWQLEKCQTFYWLITKQLRTPIYYKLSDFARSLFRFCAAGRFINMTRAQKFVFSIFSSGFIVNFLYAL